jgi:hypothetical protein
MSDATQTSAGEQTIERRLAALATAVDGLYDEINALSLQRVDDGAASEGASPRFAALLADVHRLLPVDRPATATPSEPPPPYALGELELWLAGHTG